MNRRFAADTSVSVEKTKAEIESLVIRYGAKGFSSGWEEGRAAVMFSMRDRRIRFILPLPRRDDKAFAMTPARRHTRSPAEREKAWEQACRQRWRALCLAIKAKLEAVAVGISEFDSEFMANIVDPETGRTLGEQIVPQIAAAYEGKSERPIALLPAPTT